MMKTSKLKYYIDDRDNDTDAQHLTRKWDWQNNFSEDPEQFAVQAAEYCQDHRDGWEWEWPKVFVILDGNEEVGRFEVTREYAPEFYATEVTRPGPKPTPPHG